MKYPGKALQYDVANTVLLTSMSINLNVSEYKTLQETFEYHIFHLIKIPNTCLLIH